ncbi:phage minor head protein [Dysgonomonas termitidis]|uniref:Phage minor head protein n=1 Tax=Dysgonomonas termitidis TaxID=1516126 RepID=A0ABV9KTS4_9BACT
MYKSKHGVYSPELVQGTAGELTDALSEGYGDIAVDWDTPDHLMLEKLTENVFQFSAAKSYQQLRDITLALRDGEGNLREPGDFMEAVDALGYKYNREWLQTEYYTAVASATAAARWVEYNREADLFPMLRYETVGDNRVRAEHRLLDGIVRHIKDVFWQTYYPPNGFRCRCEALQEPDSDAAETGLPVHLPQVPPMFKTNLAENGLLFPKNHPYYEGVPKDVLRRAMQYLPEDYAYRTRDGYEEHAMLQHEPEAEENRAIAEILAGNGEKDIKLLPRLHEKEIDLRKKYYGEEYVREHPAKCPDSFIGGEPAEFKESGKANMSKRVLDASRQADIVVIKTKEVLTEGYIDMFIKGQWDHDDRLNVKRIIIINDGKTHKYERPEIQKR